MKSNECLIDCLAMSIVNFTNEKNNVSVDLRQKNNDECFDFAIKKIQENLVNNHDHKWKSVYGTTDVVCTICGIRAMQMTLKHKAVNQYNQI